MILLNPKSTAVINFISEKHKIVIYQIFYQLFYNQNQELTTTLISFNRAFAINHK